MKRTTLAAILVVAGTASVVSARRVMEYREVAAPSVIDVSTVSIGRTTYRAITGIEQRRPYLLLEELGWNRPTGRRGGRGYPSQPGAAPGPTDFPEIREDADLRERYDDRDGRRGALVVRTQRPITFVDVRNRRVNLEQFRFVTLEGWSNGRLIFSAQGDRAAFRCTVGVRDAAPATCEGTWSDGPAPGPMPNPGPNPGPYPGPNPGPAPGPYPTPPAPPTDLERLRAATQACGGAFYDSATRETCIQLALRAQVDLFPAIAACNQSLTGSQDKLACIQQAAAYPGDAAALIRQCSRSFSGSTDLMACFRTMVENNLPLAVIPACDAAMTGSSERFRCMRAVAGSRMEPAALIKYCRENHSGSSAVIQCIERYR